MPDEGPQQQPDTARPSATRYSLTLDETARLFAEAGLPRNIRSLQRYCAAGRLDCIKEETATGLTFFVDPDSVGRAITQLAQLHGITDEERHGAVVSDMSHRVAPVIEPNPQFDQPRASAAERDIGAQEISERPTPPQSDMSRYVAQVESENAMLKEHVAFLKEQAQVKDTQIAALLERDKETNYLVRGVQQMLAPLLGRGGEPTQQIPLPHRDAADISSERLSFRSSVLSGPRRRVPDDGVEDCEQLTQAGDDGDLFWSSSRDEALIDGLDQRVVSDGDEGGHV